jgi:hypothetical protein
MSDDEPSSRRSFSTNPGDQFVIHGVNTLSRVLITYPDGAEIELVLGPNDKVRVKVGSQMAPGIQILPLDQDLGDLGTVE